MTAMVPITPLHKFWSDWGGIVVSVVFAIFTSALAWRFPANFQPRFSLGLLAVGLFFDVMSAFYYVLSFVSRRFMSGFPFVGLLCYMWAWLAMPRPDLYGASGGLASLWICKGVDLAVLFGGHLLIHAFLLFSGRISPPHDRA